MSGNATSTLVARFRRNSRDELRIEIGQFNGHEFVSVRTYTELPQGNALVPTKKGITVRPGAQLAALIAALQDAQRLLGEAPTTTYAAAAHPSSASTH